MPTKKYIKLNTDQLIALLAVYEKEWEERDNILWKQSFRFFYLSIFIMIIPNISDHLSLKLPSISPKTFPIVGIISATISLYLSFGYAKRLVASGDTYMKLINKLPYPYRRIRLVKIKFGKFFNKRLTTLIPLILYTIIIFIGIVLLVKQ